MSLILDALNRSERERRSTQPVPGLNTVHQPVAHIEANPWPTWVKGLIGVILVLAAAALLAWVWPSMFGVATTREPPEDVNTRTAEDSPYVVQQSTQVPVEADRSKAKSETRSVLAPEPLRSIDVMPLNENATKQAVDALYKERVIEPDVREDERIVARQWLTDLPERIKNKIPSIYYSMHIYSDEGEDNFVVLNGEPRRTGEQIDAELQLLAIHSEYIELEFQGTAFRLQSLNSWVNL